jgi:hypothetical protein
VLREIEEGVVVGRLVRGRARRLAKDQRGKGEIPGNVWRCNQSWEDVDAERMES